MEERGWRREREKAEGGGGEDEQGGGGSGEGEEAEEHHGRCGENQKKLYSIKVLFNATFSNRRGF